MTTPPPVPASAGLDDPAAAPDSEADPAAAPDSEADPAAARAYAERAAVMDAWAGLANHFGVAVRTEPVTATRRRRPHQRPAVPPRESGSGDVPVPADEPCPHCRRHAGPTSSS